VARYLEARWGLTRGRMERQLRNVHFPARLVSLSDRQKQIVALICEGLSNKRIARQLNVTEGTVKSQLHTIYEKLGVQSRYAVITSLSNRGRV
jgi:RNA polymerase sigma factor (sigma-70 family)